MRRGETLQRITVREEEVPIVRRGVFFYSGVFFPRFTLAMPKQHSTVRRGTYFAPGSCCVGAGCREGVMLGAVASPRSC